MVARVEWAFQVSQGSVETLFRWDGEKFNHFAGNGVQDFTRIIRVLQKILQKKTFWSLFSGNSVCRHNNQTYSPVAFADNGCDVAFVANDSWMFWSPDHRPCCSAKLGLKCCQWTKVLPTEWTLNRCLTCWLQLMFRPHLHALQVHTVSTAISTHTMHTHSVMSLDQASVNKQLKETIDHHFIPAICHISSAETPVSPECRCPTDQENWKTGAYHTSSPGAALVTSSTAHWLQASCSCPQGVTRPTSTVPGSRSSLRLADVLTCAIHERVSETGVFPSLDRVSGTLCLSRYVTEISHLHSLTDFWRHFGLCRAAAHSDCCFFAPCTNILTYLLTYSYVLLIV